MSNNFCTIYLVRHGLSGANVARTVGGNTGLVEKGKEQAMELGKKLKDIDFAAVFSSDLLRARQTAELIIEGRNLEVSTHKELRERSFGSIDNKNDKEFIHLFQALKDVSDDEYWKWKIVDDMESAQEAFGRFFNALKKISKKYLGKEILIVSHGTVMRSLLVYLGYGSFKELPTNSLQNTGYIKLKSDGENFIIEDTWGVNKMKGLSL